jgi:F-type H+-transporting ATPase subunit b
MHGTENIGPLAISPALVFTEAVGFLILLVLLNRFVFKPIFAILDERQKTIQDTYDQLDEDRTRMEETRRQYEARLAAIEDDARERIQAAVKEAQQLRDNLIADAQQQAETIVESGRTEVERERQKAFLEMRGQIVALTVAAAGKLVGESLDDARHAKLVDDFIAGVDDGTVAHPGHGASSTNNGAQRGPTAA